MKIAEIFHSIQGEGILSGVPSVFIRTSGCNLRCVWCDTPYTSWNPEGAEMPVAAILERALSRPFRHAVVTGGEPMIAPQIVELTQALRSAALHITVETAGTVIAPVACDLMSVSPKLANSTPREREAGRWAAQHDRLRYQPAILRRLIAAYPYQLKFVIAAPEDVEEAAAIVAETSASPDRVLLMPEGIAAETLRERGRWLAAICQQRGWRYGPRLHVDLWGNQRGV